jgi:hypothetical protein
LPPLAAPEGPRSDFTGRSPKARAAGVARTVIYQINTGDQ